MELLVCARAGESITDREPGVDSKSHARTVSALWSYRCVLGMPSRIREGQSSPEQSAEGTLPRALELKFHSFIVKVWLEETNQSGRAIWRGHITHVPGGERRYVRQLSEIETFIAPYLHTMGVGIGIRQRIKKWLWP